VDAFLHRPSNLIGIIPAQEWPEVSALPASRRRVFVFPAHARPLRRIDTSFARARHRPARGVPIMTTPLRLTRRQLSLALAAGAIGAAAPGLGFAQKQETETVTLALDWYPNANHAGIYLARERGWFAEAGIDLEPYTPSDPTTVLQTVGAGRDDFGISYQTDVLLARAQEVPVVSVAAIVQRPLVTVMALEEEGIVSPADLAGKTIGYPGIPSQAAFLETMLEGAGLTMDDVTLVNIGFNLLPALISGQADAVLGGFWTHETIIAEREGHAITVLRVEDWGVPEYYELVLVASEETVAERPEMVGNMLGALERGYLAAIEEPEAALEALTAAYPELDQEVEREGIALLSEVWLPDPPVFGAQDPARWESFGEWMKSRDLVPDGLDISAAYIHNQDTQRPATPEATQA
jgi:putative hydroxymethylpyrimidine transport system substrate-binding protein